VGTTINVWGDRDRREARGSHSRQAAVLVLGWLPVKVTGGPRRLVPGPAAIEAPSAAVEIGWAGA
jgi:hypothetical protein